MATLLQYTMRIISIDPGYDKVGYAIFDKNPDKKTQYKYITSDLIKTDPKTAHHIRLRHIYDELKVTIAEHSVEALIVEELFMFKNQKTVIKVAQSIGVIELVAAHTGLRIHHFTPLQIKSILTGYGTADKKAVQKMVNLTLGHDITFKDDDQVDAVACGLAYCFVNDKLL